VSLQINIEDIKDCKEEEMDLEENFNGEFSFVACEQKEVNKVKENCNDQPSFATCVKQEDEDAR
jgi:hypothetical protein